MQRAAVLLWVLAIAPLSSTRAVAQTRSPSTLDIYVIDVEGGNATLFVRLPVSRYSSIRAMQAPRRLAMRVASWKRSGTPDCSRLII
jgi:hypothetical protein